MKSVYTSNKSLPEICINSRSKLALASSKAPQYPEANGGDREIGFR